MANFRAIRGVTEAVVEVLRTSYTPADFDNELEFRVFNATDFASPPAYGVSLFLYRIYGYGAQRTPVGRLANGVRLQTELPLELHFLLTFWGSEASMQHTIAGWAMRTLEDTPLLPAGLLNTVSADVFRDDETVQISLGDLRTEDLFRIYDFLDLEEYQISVPYLARVVAIESGHPQVNRLGGGLVQDRVGEAATIVDAEEPIAP